MPAGSWPSTVGTFVGKMPLREVQIAVAQSGADGSHEHLAQAGMVDADILDV